MPASENARPPGNIRLLPNARTISARQRSGRKSSAIQASRGNDAGAVLECNSVAAIVILLLLVIVIVLA
jgi:hypothetical protein